MPEPIDLTPDVDLVVADVGNSTHTLALLAGDRVVALRRFSHRDSDSAGQIGAFLAGVPDGTPAALAGVAPRLQAELAALLAPRLEVAIAPEEFQAQVRNRCHPAQNVGQDRLFNAAGAGLHQLPLVIVDAGSAITVDRVDVDGAFRGGAIAPGIRLSYRALSRDTGRLPELDQDTDHEAGIPEPLGTDTVPAIRSGVRRGLAGLIDRLVEEIGEGSSPRVILTGGDAALFEPLLRCRPLLDEQLTIRGIARSYRAREAVEQDGTEGP